MTDPARKLSQAHAHAEIVGKLNALWTPHDAQTIILQRIFRDLVKVAFVECGRKLGKTELIAYFLWRMALTNPGGHYYLAPEQKQAKEIVWASGRIQSFGPQEFIESINATEMRIRFTNGSFIKVDGSDNFNAYRGIEPHSAAYDEFRDFRPEFHKAMSPNFGVYNAPLLVCGTPPEQLELDHYDAMKRESEERGSYFNYPSWFNPHFSRTWLEEERLKLLARGEGDIWEREYGARRVVGGSLSIFPMFDRKRHVRRHAELLAAVWQDKKKLHWQAVADPGNATVFCVNFRAINPYTREVFHLAEIYETRQSETSTSKMVPRIRAMMEELFPGHEAYGVDWDLIYDEAATWFSVEASNSFDMMWHPTHKGLRNKDDGLSLMKDQMLHMKFLISDRCVMGIKEIEGYLKDPKSGKPLKKNDHYIDTCRYGNDFSGLDLEPNAEPEPVDPLSRPRFYTREQDERAEQTEDGDGFDILDDF